MNTRGGEGKDLTIRTLYLPALASLVAAVLLACAAALLAVSKEAEATFPGKNGRIAYSAFGERTDDAIYTINPGEGATTKVTRGYQPSYSPDGKRIAYTSYDGHDTEIYTIKVGGGSHSGSSIFCRWHPMVVSCDFGKTRVTNDNKDDNFPSYSPNGKRIAYTRTTYRRINDTVSADPIDEIFTVKVGGGGKTKVTNGSDPSYSPDGKKIVYYAYDNSLLNQLAYTEIYTINVRGGDTTQLTHNNKDEFTPDYSPDGKRIVYAGLEGLERDDAESDIYTINAGGGGKTKVTNNDNADDLHPSYSPDGKKIAYTVYNKGNVIEGDIYTIKVGGGGKSKVTNGHGPSWGSR